MTDPVLWDIALHTTAKHRVLRSYVDAWLPVMAYQAIKMGPLSGPPRLLLVDGFAGPGRYVGGEPGSPLVMLQSLLARSDLPKLERVEFLFLFIEHDARRVKNLEVEIANLGPLPGNVKVTIEHGSFEVVFGSLLADFTGHGKRLIPTFAFIDPFGYAGARRRWRASCSTFVSVKSSTFCR